jgi:hypothetical protein
MLTNRLNAWGWMRFRSSDNLIGIYRNPIALNVLAHSRTELENIIDGNHLFVAREIIIFLEE